MADAPIGIFDSGFGGLTVARAVTGKVLPAFIIHLVFNGIQSVLIVLGAFVDKDILK